MSYVLELIGSMSVGTVITVIAAVAFIVALGVKIYKAICEYHDEQQEKEELLKNVAKNVQLLATNQKKLQTKMQEMYEIQKGLIKKQEDIENKNNNYNLNKLRDKLLSNYQFYTDKNRNPLGMWSEMEKEVFDKLFEDYEELGGNGLMHTTVQPAMLSLQVVKMKDTAELVRMMQSRK